jgi:hypothetical protein
VDAAADVVLWGFGLACAVIGGVLVYGALKGVAMRERFRRAERKRE